MNFVEKMWYGPSWYHWSIIILLLPFVFLFWMLSACRRYVFRLQLKKGRGVAVPVIVVGNIGVGGNGKTPLVIYLAKRLRQEGYHPGVLSRGYGGKNAVYPMEVEGNSSASVVGDEPLLMRRHINCPLVVDPVRPRGAQKLVEEHKCDVIICDDGLQHYALDRDIEIVVVDGQRRFGNGMLLPSGPLREGKWRLQTVDFVVLNGGVVTNGEHLMALESGRLVNVKRSNKSTSLNDIPTSVTAIAGIGNPDRFFNLLEQKGVNIKERISFADHYQFQEGDIPNETVIMTEKDAVKCTEFAHDDWWYLPVNATLTEQFENQMLSKLIQVVADKQNSREK